MRKPDAELLREIYYSIRQNMGRTILSGFGISWGILILVVLLGTGQGFQNSVMSLFSVFAQKSIYVYGGKTSMKHENIKEGVNIRFDKPYLEQLKSRFPEIEAISPEIVTSAIVLNGLKSGSFRITGVNADYMNIKILQVKDGGRRFSQADNDKERNVAIIGENVETILFANKEGLGEYVNISGMFFKVIGILRNDDIFSAGEINSIYIPFPSYLKTLNSNPEFSSFALYLSRDTNSKKFEEKLRDYIAHHSQFSSSDKQAVYITNFETQTSAFESLFKGIRMFIWIVGICFLISGIAGISNIMFVVVKERTNEIGIRLAVGAAPKSIINLILLEAIVITALSGLIGLILGKGILMFVDWILSTMKDEIFMQQTSLDMTVASFALLLLIISGVVAGVFPAIKASNIEPVDAIRYEARG